MTDCNRKLITSKDADWLAYLVLGSVGLVGNIVLFLGAYRCVTQRHRTSCMLLLNIASVHLIRILVVNLLNVVSALADVVIFSSTGCKIIQFTSTLTNMLAIWFTLYVALFYSVRLNRVVHPLTSTPTADRRTILCIGMLVLWAIAIGVSYPLLLYVEKGQCLQNKTDGRDWAPTACQVKYTNPVVELIYGRIILTFVDVLPLMVLLLVGFRITVLLRGYRVATYGDIWIGEDKSEREVFMASKLVFPLMFLVCALWISHHTLLQFLDQLVAYSFFPLLLAVLSSVYSALSPFILIAMSYKVRVSLMPSCFSNPKLTKSLPAMILTSPYAE